MRLRLCIHIPRLQAAGPPGRLDIIVRANAVRGLALHAVPHDDGGLKSTHDFGLLDGDDGLPCTHSLL